MNKKTLVTYSYMILVLFYSGFSASSPVNYFKKLHQDSPANTTALIEDDSGLLWVGSKSGVYTFDGYQFRYQASINQSLSDTRVTNFNIVNNNLVISTESGLNFVNLNDKTVKKYSPDEESGNLSGHFVGGSLFDNKFYVINRKGDLFEFDTHLSLLSKKDISLKTELFVYKVLPCDSSLYFATSDGLYFVPKSGSKIKEVDNSLTSNKAVVDLLCHKKELLVVTNDKIININSSDEIVDISEISDNSDRLSLIAKAQNKLFVVTFNGELIELIFEDSVFKGVVDSNYLGFVTGIYSIKKNELWLTTMGDGLAFKSIKRELSNSLEYNKELESCNIKKGIYGTVFDRSDLVFTAYNSGVYRWNLNNKHCQSERDDSGRKKVSGFYPIARLDNNQYAIGTAGYGLLLLNKHDESLINSRVNQEIAFNNINAVMTVNNLIYLGTMHGLIKFEPKSKSFEVIKFDGKDEALVNRIHTLEKATGGLLLGTDNGLYFYDFKNNKIVSVISTNSGRVYAVSVLNEYSVIYSVEGKGIFSFELNGNKAINHKQISKQVSAYSMLQDAKNRIWIGSDKGMHVYVNKRLIKLGVDFGLNEGSYDVGASASANKDKLAFPTNNGLMIVYPEYLSLTTEVKSPVVTQLSYLKGIENFDFDYSFNGEKLSSINELRLSYEHALLKLFVSSFEYKYSKSLTVHYRIEGLVDKWEELSSGSPIVLNRLPIGTYTLSLKTSYLGGISESSVNTIQLIIEPPWYYNDIAKSTYVALILLIILLFYYYKTRSLRRRAQALQSAVDQRTSELNKEKRNVEYLLQSKNKEFANVSHEFRTPLTLVLGPVSRLLEKEENADKKSKLQLVKRNTYRLMRMVDQLIYMEKARINKAVVKKPVAVSPIFKFITDSFEDLCLLKNIKLKVSYDEDIWCLATKESVEKVLLNLLSNALKYTPEYGVISVSLKKLDEKFEFSVEDTGYGIPADMHEFVFNRFERVIDKNSESITGAGIGLSLVKELLDEHNGSIELKSIYGSGSLFTVYWPIIEAPDNSLAIDDLSSDAIDMELESLKEYTQTTMPKSEPTTEADGSGKPLVLLIEDNRDMRQYIEEIISAKFSCITAKDGEEGIALAKEHIPDLIISDVMMPKQDGFQVSQNLKDDEKTSHIPIILLTARGDKESRLTGWEKNVDEFLIKPFDEDELLIRIDNLLSIREILKSRFNQEVVSSSINGDAKDISGLQHADQLFIDKVNVQIDENYGNSKFSASSLAESIGYSDRQLQRKMKNLIDLSPSEYLKHIRLNKALQKLKSGQVIKMVAFDCGFSTLPHFSNCFKAKFGITPKQAQYKSALKKDFNI